MVQVKEQMIPNDSQRKVDILPILVTSADFMHMYLFFSRGASAYMKFNWTGTGTRAAGVLIVPRFKVIFNTISIGDISFERVVDMAAASASWEDQTYLTPSSMTLVRIKKL